MSKLYITRGIPGSGKSTWAKAWVAEDPNMRARVNRDCLREMLHDGVHTGGNGTEVSVIAARDALITTLLKRGIDVVSDDTNLPKRTLRDLKKIADRSKSDLEIVDHFLDVPLGICLSRNANRMDKPPVPEDVVRGYWERFSGPQTRWGYSDLAPASQSLSGVPTEPYTGTPGKPEAIIVDIDGTVAKMNGRGPFEEHRVSEDLPHTDIIRLVHIFRTLGYKILFVSGRTDACMEDTQQWLYQHVGWFEALFMRKAGDTRKDSTVKSEIFNDHVRLSYDVKYVLDDRASVIRDCWRAMGIRTLAVDEGDF